MPRDRGRIFPAPGPRRGPMLGPREMVRGQRGVYRKTRWGVYHTYLPFGFFVLSRPTRAASAGRGKTGATVGCA